MLGEDFLENASRIAIVKGASNSEQQVKEAVTTCDPRCYVTDLQALVKNLPV